MITYVCDEKDLRNQVTYETKWLMKQPCLPAFAWSEIEDDRIKIHDGHDGYDDGFSFSNGDGSGSNCSNSNAWPTDDLNSVSWPWGHGGHPSVKFFVRNTVPKSGLLLFSVHQKIDIETSRHLLGIQSEKWENDLWRQSTLRKQTLPALPGPGPRYQVYSSLIFMFMVVLVFRPVGSKYWTWCCHRIVGSSDGVFWVVVRRMYWTI